MRFSRGLLAGLAGLVAVALAGCVGASAPPPYPDPALPSANSSLTATGATHSTVRQTGPTEPETRGGARAAASKFYRLYSVGQFAATWDLLSRAAQEAIPRSIWIGVHNGCPSTGVGTTRLIRSVLVFGNAAIVTESIAGPDSRLGKTEDVFNYVRGRWGYAPDDLSIYHHGAVAADIAAAKRLGFCAGRKATLP